MEMTRNAPNLNPWDCQWPVAMQTKPKTFKFLEHVSLDTSDFCKLGVCVAALSFLLSKNLVTLESIGDLESKAASTLAGPIA